MSQTDDDRRMQRRALNRALDAIEDPTLSPEEVQRKITASSFNASMHIDDLLLALCRRIGRWQPPGAQSTREEARAAYHAYARLSRLTDALSNVLTGMAAAINRATAAAVESQQSEPPEAEPAQQTDDDG